MWFGTYDGLNRYDGYTFKTFRNEIRNQNSLSNNTVYCLEGDANRNIWVGGNKGASVYDKSKALFFQAKFRSRLIVAEHLHSRRDKAKHHCKPSLSKNRNKGL